MSAAEVKGPWFDVPSSTPASECRSCKAEVYWIVTASGKRMPIECAVDGGLSPWKGVPGDGDMAGRGISHFATCPQAGTWRQR